MMLNYHEMTMTESRDSPARRKQFLIICTIIAGGFFHGVLTAGFFNSLDIKEGVFPGGEFVYRYNSRDYAASVGLWEYIAEDVNVTSKFYQDFMYSLFLDSPMQMGGERQRFASGILVDNKGMKEHGQKLLDMNPGIAKKSAATPNQEDLAPFKRFKLQEYKTVSLPSVDAAVVQFPFTNGFMSAVAASYKVIPAMRKYAKEKGEEGNVAVVITTCSPRQQMCTHYAPLLKGDEFLLGQPTSEDYLASLPPEKIIDLEAMFNWEATKKGLKKYIPPLRSVL